MLPICITITAFILIIGYVVITMFDECGDLGFLYLCLVTLVGIIVGAFYFGYKSNEYSCEKKATAQGLEYKYGFWTGCLVKERDGNYIDYGKYRVMK